MSYEPETRNRLPARIRQVVYCGPGTCDGEVAEWDVLPEGAELRLLRTTKGVTLRRAAEAAHMRPSLWSDLETGRRLPLDPAVWTVLRAAVATAERQNREGGAP